MSMNNFIKVYARLKPGDPNELVTYDIRHNSKRNKDELYLYVPGEYDLRQSHNKFLFHKVLDAHVHQETVFDSIVRPVISRVLTGYNGTIFAYGQSGSGKTHTMTGSMELYSERGIIPRTIQFIFNSIQNSPEVQFHLHVSYLEIYNECGYDLLDQKNPSQIDDLQRVTSMEDNLGNTHLKNLSVVPVNEESEALKLLFLGETNRTIAETPLNQFSTRSHCVFTIHIRAENSSSKTVRKGKLHLVDLAGSERITKSLFGEARTITEAKNINLSLHYLEQVIVALSETNRHHIPYRNSLLTSVLRDSLGGNCLTSMVATLSLSNKNFMETVSTCRFSERVALINNDDVCINEEVDPQQQVIALKSEIHLLKSQLTILSNKDVSGDLTILQENKCREAVNKFVQGTSNELEIEELDLRKIRYCFQLLKNMSRSSLKSNSTTRVNSTTSLKSIKSSNVENKSESETVETYKQLIQQRDNEIAILINLLRKEKQHYRDQSHCQTDRTVVSNLSPPDSPPSCHTPIISSSNSPKSFHLTDSTLNDISSSCFNYKIGERKQTLQAEKIEYEEFRNNSEFGKEIKKCQAAIETKVADVSRLGSKIQKLKIKILLLQKDIKNKETEHCDVQPIKEKISKYHEKYKETKFKLKKLTTEIDLQKRELDTANQNLKLKFQEWYKQEQIPCRDERKPKTFEKSIKFSRDLIQSEESSPEVTPRWRRNRSPVLSSPTRSVRNLKEAKEVGGNRLIANLKKSNSPDVLKSITESYGSITSSPVEFSDQPKKQIGAKSSILKNTNDLKIMKQRCNGMSSGSGSSSDASSPRVENTKEVTMLKKPSNQTSGKRRKSYIPRYSSPEKSSDESEIVKNSKSKVETLKNNGSKSCLACGQDLIEKTCITKCENSMKMAGDLETIQHQKIILQNVPAIETNPNSIQDLQPELLKQEEDVPSDWDTFVKSLPLTGDEEIDAEILSFYKSKFGKM